MADVLTPEQRRLNMRGIRGQNTKPEMILRRGLHALGLRYQLHRRDLNGRPDLVFPGYRAVLFVHGCFWHGHQCHLFKVPATRTQFWINKISKNSVRDKEVTIALQKEGWRVVTIWECAVRGKERLDLRELFDKVVAFLRTRECSLEIEGGNGSG